MTDKKKKRVMTVDCRDFAYLCVCLVIVVLVLAVMEQGCSRRLAANSMVAV